MLALVLAFSGCGGGGSTSVPATAPVILSSTGSTAFALSPGSASTQFSVTEFGYSGSYTATSSNLAVATVSPATQQSSADARGSEAIVAAAANGSATFTITAVANGSAIIAVVDNQGHSSPFTVVVTGIPNPAPSATPSAIPTASPTPLPSPGASPGPLTVSPVSLTFNGTAQVQTVTVTDPGTTSFTVSGCSGVATLGAPANGTFTVTSAGAGACTITVSDAFSHQATLAVSVTTLGVPIQ